MIARYVAALLLVPTLSGCEQARKEADDDLPPPASGTERPLVVFLGTSLTAGFGLELEQAYPALIQRKIDSAGLHFQTVNAGVSGETSAGARRRIEWVLRQPVSVLVVETGANDGLRGLPVDSLKANIQAVLDRAKAANPRPELVLIGMRIPPNYGRTYTNRFHAVYTELAQENGAALVPFLLQGVGGVASLNQSDGIHPTAEGQQRMAETVWKVLEPILVKKTT